MRDFKKNKGITLIALVITIIVLLILAGVSLSLVMGEGGILGRTTRAVNKTKKASVKEEFELALAEVRMSYYTDNTEGKTMSQYFKDTLNGYKTPNGSISCEADGNVIYTGSNGNLTGTIDENGKFEYTSHVPVVNNICITLKDGSPIPEYGAEDGTELKIDFTASIEEGTITSISPVVPYVTNGTEKEVKFSITGTVEGETYTGEKTIDLKDKYKKRYKAEDIAKEVNEFYGSIVANYQVNVLASNNVKNAVKNWRIFYAGKEPGGTEENIYLIADDYISYIATPNSQGGTAITKGSTDYKLSFEKVCQDYNGSKWIRENSLAKNWLNNYFNYTPDEGVSYPNRESENANIKSVAYMMDTKIWNVYVGNNAKYAIGSPPVEMFCMSYKNSYPTSELNYNCNLIGYNILNGASLSTGNNNIYIKPEMDKTNGMFLASPSCANKFYQNEVLAYANGSLSIGFAGRI